MACVGLEPWPSRRRCPPLPWERASSSRVLPNHGHLFPTAPTPCLPACPQFPTCSAARRAQIDLDVRHEHAQTGSRARHGTESGDKCTSLSRAPVLARTPCVVHPSPAISHFFFTSRSSLLTNTHTHLHKRCPRRARKKRERGRPATSNPTCPEQQRRGQYRPRPRPMHTCEREHWPHPTSRRPAAPESRAPSTRVAPLRWQAAEWSPSLPPAYPQSVHSAHQCTWLHDALNEALGSASDVIE
jgi:hypothetical protein